MVNQDLFDYMKCEHGIILLESDAKEIERIMFSEDYKRLTDAFRESQSTVPSEEEIESFRKLSREKMLDRCGTLTEIERYQLGNWFDAGFETANNFIKRGIAG